MAYRVRYARILWEALSILRDRPEPLNYRTVLDTVRERIQPTAYELEQVKNGARWEIAVHFLTGDAATIGWMSKRGGWTLSEAGAAALDAYPSPEALYAERNRRYREIDQQRKQAQEHLSDVHQFIAETLRALQPGYWTAFDDLAELAGTTAGCPSHADRRSARRCAATRGHRAADAGFARAEPGRQCPWPRDLRHGVPHGRP